MMKYLPLLFLLISTSAISYTYPWVGFLLLGVIGVAVIALAAGRLSRVIWPGSSKKWVQVPLYVLIISTIAVGVGLVRPLAPAVLHTPDASKALAYAYETDQSDRFALKPYLSISTDNLGQRDQLRLKQVTQFYEAQKLVSPIQKFHAAFIFHHSNNKEHHERAHMLAVAAASADELKKEYVVQWLAKASYDRWMVSSGKPQKYGTQGKFSLSVE